MSEEELEEKAKRYASYNWPEVDGRLEWQDAVEEALRIGFLEGARQALEQKDSQKEEISDK